MKNSAKRVVSALLLALLALSACATKKPAPRPDSPIPEAGGLAPQGPFSMDELANGTYRSEWNLSGEITLSGGEWKGASVEGSAIVTRVKMSEHVAFGTVDGEPAAAVILVADPGGSGTFYDLALVKRVEGRAVNVGNAHLGDRVRIHSLSIEDGRVAVDLTAHRPGDPLCCPTLKAVRYYSLSGSGLAADGSGSQGVPGGELTGTLWKWQRTRYNNDTESAPPDPDHYTLELGPEGRVGIRADCNRGGGEYRIEGNRILIEITHTTRAACPPESLEGPYIRDLNGAALFFFRGDSLYIDLVYDTGTMQFSR